MHRSRLALLVIVAVGATAPLALASTMTIPRDGRWGGIEGSGGAMEIASLKIRDRAVRDVQFSVPLRCHNRDTGDDFVTAFRGGKQDAAPDGRRIPRSGVLRLRWTEDDAGREAHVLVEITFAARRPTMTVNFETHGEMEDCEAFSVVRLKHSAS